MKQIASPMQVLTPTDQLTMARFNKIQSLVSLTGDTPYHDALVLLAHITGKSKAHILAHPEIELTIEQEHQVSDGIQKLRDGFPLPYVLGRWEFYQLPLIVNQNVLIPRPETEGLVDRALAWLHENPGRNNCLDLGTGSGCIAVAIAINNPGYQITASDISERALDTARRNSQLHAAEKRIRFIQSNLLDDIDGKFDLLVSNLPYIPTQKLKTLAVSQFEPNLALDGGPDGLSLIKKTLKDAPGILNPGALILLELDEDCGPQAVELARKAFPAADFRLEQDLAGLDRYLIIQT